MRLRPCVDFLRKRNVHYLTISGQRKIQNIKLTGTKIPEFFDFDLQYPDEEEEQLSNDNEEPTTKSEWKLWSNIFGFEYVPKGNPQRKEQYRKIEELIKKYLEDNLNKKWINYPLDLRDAFEEVELLGGVPDGEEINNLGKTETILEIKTITESYNVKKTESRFKSPPINYQLQLGLYMMLREIDIGYICLCYLKGDNWKDIESIKLDTNLRLYSDNRKPLCQGSIKSFVPDIGICPYEYRILECWCNDGLVNNEIIVFKIQINMEKYKEMIDKLCVWFQKHKSISPEMNPEELKRLLKKNKNL